MIITVKNDLLFIIKLTNRPTSSYQFLEQIKEKSTEGNK